MTWPSLSHDAATSPPAHADPAQPTLDLHARERPASHDAATRADDAALVARIRVGDEAAFERMFRAYYNRLCVFVTRYVGAPDLAEELVEAVFARIWEHRATWEVRGTLTAYLYTAARYQVLDFRRHAAVERRMRERSAHEGLAPGLSQGTLGSDQRQECEAADLARALHDAVERLPERCRVIFTLRWQHNLSYAEIAATLGVATKTVETQLNRAFKALRERLRPYR
jgi:RNA polymerase sigma-70 factor (ECF subfamily)